MKHLNERNYSNSKSDYSNTNLKPNDAVCPICKDIFRLRLTLHNHMIKEHQIPLYKRKRTKKNINYGDIILGDVIDRMK